MSWAAWITAIELVKKKAGLPAGEQVRVTVYPPRRTLFEMLVKRSQEDALNPAWRAFSDECRSMRGCTEECCG